MADTSDGRAARQRTVGIIGLGIMGGAMARNLVAGGWRVIGYDSDANAIATARQNGIETVDDAAAVAASASDIITSLPSAEAVMTTAQTVAASAPAPVVVLEMSTLSLDDKEEVASLLAAKHHIALD